MLDIDLTTIIFQIINFLILVVVLYFLLFKKIIQRAETRKAELEKIRLDAVANFQESERLRSELENSVNSFNEKLDEFVSRAKSELEVIRYQVINEIKAEAEQIYHQAQEDTKSAQKKSLEEFHTNIMDLTLEITKSLLSGSTTIEIHENLVKQINDRIWDMGKKEMRQVETIRRSLTDREPSLYVITAIPLSKDLQGHIIRTFSALADKNIKLEIKHDETLISGVRIRLGDYIVENSLLSKLEEIKDLVSEELQTQLNNLISK